jgi:hypothetical protein
LSARRAYPTVSVVAMHEFDHKPGAPWKGHEA